MAKFMRAGVMPAKCVRRLAFIVSKSTLSATVAGAMIVSNAGAALAAGGDNNQDATSDLIADVMIDAAAVV